MARKTNGAQSQGGFVARFNLAGLIWFILALTSLGASVSYLALARKPASVATTTRAAKPQATASAPWGELSTVDIELEPPEDYLTYELSNLKPPEWQFNGMSPAQVRSLMTECGLPPELIKCALTPPMSACVGPNTIIHPDDSLVLSLTPAMRQKLYRALGRIPGNLFMQYPYIYPGRTFEVCLRDNKLDENVEKMIRLLLYPRGETQCFSDVNTVVQHLTTKAEKISLLRVLARQPAVVARLQVYPDSDINKIVEYWGNGARENDLRPLLDSLARVPEGGSLSVLYLLPPFARQRLYTFPAPAHPGDPAMDCHWTTANFFNVQPDNRFSDSNVAMAYIRSNCHAVAEPGKFGDIIIFLDDQNRAVHSSVYLADDLVFTKNGNNFAQPWKLSRLKNLRAHYELDAPVKLSVWRMKNQ